MIRLLSSDDATTIRHLRLLSLQTDPEAFVSTYEYEQQFSLEYIARKINYISQPPSFGYWGYQIEEKIVGYCQLVRETMPKCNHQVNLYELYVLPEYRHHHLARDLLTRLIEVCRNHPEISQLRLKVNTNNITARRLYETLGFSLYGQIDNAIRLPNNSYQGELLYYLSV